ncbi:MAG: ParA family protein [Leptolyngbyaceae bacterium]|nr:ParA family protein [Leptolyngbyaceae bacterium]
MGYVISTVNMKGGVGKTTLSVNLAAALAKYYDKKVLVVDLDTQISATLSLMSPSDFAKVRKEKRTLRQLVNQTINPKAPPIFSTQEIIVPYVAKVKGLDLLVGDIELYDEYLVSEVLHEQAVREGSKNFEQIWNNFERVLVKKILQPVLKNYDFVILDCAPGYNLLTQSGIISSNFYLLPAKPEPLSLIGIQLLERRIAKLREAHPPDELINMQLMGIVFTMSGTLITGRYYRQVMERVNQDFSATKIFKTRIPTDVNISKAVDSFMPVVLTNPSTVGSKAFIKLTGEFLEKLKLVVGVKEQTKNVSLTEMD